MKTHINGEISKTLRTVEKEANINELKGHLFEFIVGQKCAQQWGIEAAFLRNLRPQVQKDLFNYQSLLRPLDPELFKSLPQLAQSVAMKLDSVFKTQKIVNIHAIGKLGQRGEVRKLWGEADLLFVTDKKKEIPISLKLSKEKAFVNTKSAGIKSFINSYFSDFADCFKAQERLNQLVDNSFMTLGYELYELANLEFSGRFDESWKAAGLPQLPGELNSDMKQVLGKHYNRMITCIHEILGEFYEADSVKFLQALYPLCGFTKEDILQVKCFHENRYQLKNVQVLSLKDVQSSGGIKELKRPKDGLSSFEMQFKDFKLQIRVKPMNVFTVPSVKINCSIKYLS